MRERVQRDDVVAMPLSIVRQNIKELVVGVHTATVKLLRTFDNYGVLFTAATADTEDIRNLGTIAGVK